MDLPNAQEQMSNVLYAQLQDQYQELAETEIEI